MEPYDFFILANAWGCALLFVALQLILYRFLAAQRVLKIIMLLFFVCGGINLGINLAMVRLWEMGWGAKLLCVSVTSVIYGLTVFLYVLCVWGPYESSIRLRVVREFYKAHPQGLSWEGLLTHYNAQQILQRRLDRLQVSGEVVFDGKYYHAHKRLNFFLFAHWLSLWLARITELQK